MKMFDKINIQAKFRQLTDPYVVRGREYVASLRDVRNVGILVFTVLVLLTSWSGIKAIQTNYGLQKQIATLQQQNSVAKLQNQNQQLQNQYYTTPQYLEITARQNLGLAAPGETELIVPKSVALAHTVKMPNAATVDASVPKQAGWQRNFQAWVNFFLHRGSTD